MKINFSEISPEEVRLGYEKIFQYDTVYFEILNNDSNIGFLLIFDEGNDFCEIKVHLNESFVKNMNHNLKSSCLDFAFSLGFKKVSVCSDWIGGDNGTI